MGELVRRKQAQPLAARRGFDVQKLLDAFLRRHSEKTRRAYTIDLEDFARFCGTGLNAACAQFIALQHGEANLRALEFKNHLQERSLSPNTINRRLAALRSLVALANTVGQIDWQLSVDGVRAQGYRDTAGPGLEGFRAMLDAAELTRNPLKSARDLAVLWICFADALRRAEVYSLDFEHFDLEAGKVSIMGKGRTQRETLSIPPRALEAIRNWVKVRGQAAGPMFSSLHRGRVGQRLSEKGFYHIIVELGARAGIKVHPHGLRHAGITAALEVEKDLRKVQQFSRHKNLQTIILYDDRRKDAAGDVAKGVDGLV